MRIFYPFSWALAMAIGAGCSSDQSTSDQANMGGSGGISGSSGSQTGPGGQSNIIPTAGAGGNNAIPTAGGGGKNSAGGGAKAAGSVGESSTAAGQGGGGVMQNAGGSAGDSAGYGGAGGHAETAGGAGMGGNRSATGGGAGTGGSNSPVNPLGKPAVWSTSYGDNAYQVGNAITTSPTDSSIYVTGSFQGSLNFPSSPVTSAGSNDIFVAKFDTLGTQIWARNYGDAGDQRGTDIAADSQGNIWVTGFAQGKISLGGSCGELTASGGDLFLAKLNKGSNCIVGRFFGIKDNHVSRALAVDYQDNVVLLGDLAYSGKVDFGKGPLTGTASGDIFVAKFDTSLHNQWNDVFSISSGGYVASYDVTTDNQGNVILTGMFRGSISFGSTTLHSADAGTDLFIAVLDTQGTPLWSQSFHSSGNVSAGGVAVDAAGRIFLAGGFSGSLSFDGGTTSHTSDNGAFLAKFDTDHHLLWSRSFGNNGGTTEAIHITTDSAGNVILTGIYQLQIDFGCGILNNPGLTYFATKLDGLHGTTCLWANSFDTLHGAPSIDVCTDPNGATLLTGALSSSANFGQGALVGQGQQDLFVAKIPP